MIPTTSLDSALANLKQYAQLRAAAGHPPANSKLAVWTYVAETQDEASRDAERYMIEYSDSALRHYEMLGSHFDTLKGYESYARQAAVMRENADGFRRSFYDSNPWGTPDRVVARAAELARLFGANELMFVFKYGSMPIEKGRGQHASVCAGSAARAAEAESGAADRLAPGQHGAGTRVVPGHAAAPARAFDRAGGQLISARP
ncbi:MAG: hypothetical protein R3E86_00545 [Pseudomonadales bacterium]